MKDLLGTFWHKILQHKFVAIFLFVLIFVVLEYATIIYDPHDSVYVNIMKRAVLRGAVDHSRDFFAAYNTPLQTDEYIMLLWLWPDIASEKDRAFDRDPFYRFFANDLRMRDLQISRRVDTVQELRELVERSGVETFLYELSGVSESVFTDPTDDMVLKALYCDTDGYDDLDYQLLGTIRDHEGGYGDTHYLLGLIFLTRLGCVEHAQIADDRRAVVERIINAQRTDTTFSDLYAERVVLLYWAGHGDDVAYHWIKKIQLSQMSDGGWRNMEGEVSNPHTTGLSALALKYFIDGADLQNVIMY